MLPEVYPPVIDLLISLLTALRRIYKPVINNVIHKMIESNLDFYLEEITESSRNTMTIQFFHQDRQFLSNKSRYLQPNIAQSDISQQSLI